MGRKSKSNRLTLWMNQQLVGYWEINSKGQHSLTYAQEWIDSDACRPISLSIPIQSSEHPITGEVVENYFDNLLPDSREIRKRIQANFSARTTKPFDLLKEIGRDCVGALQILSENEEPGQINEIQGKLLNEEEVATLIRRVPTTRGGTLAGSDEAFRISLAGAQEKLALLKYKEEWMSPKGSTPTTHILKLPLGKFGNNEIDMSTSVYNEWLCGEIIRAFNIPIAASEITTFEDQTVLVVKRFDRQFNDAGDALIRLPQEDMCQATGRTNGQKYEVEGGPGITEIMNLLENSVTPLEDRRTFFKSQILFWLLGAIDGHAKNFSVHLLMGGRFRLTPLYDVMSAYPVIGKGAHQIPIQKARMAMVLRGQNKHDVLSDIQPRHWVSTAAKSGFGNQVESVLDEINDLGDRVIQKVSGKLPAGFPNEVAESIFRGFSETLGRLH